MGSFVAKRSRQKESNFNKLLILNMIALVSVAFIALNGHIGDRQEGKTMALLQASVFGDRLPTPIEQDDAARLKRIMDATRVVGGGYKFVTPKTSDEGPQEVHIDTALGDALRAFLEIVSKGQSVQIVPIEAELSTKQAAQLLNVSRPFLIKLLDSDVIDHRKVGRHRRIKASDLFNYKKQQDQTRKTALHDMLRDDEADGLV